MSVSAGDLVRSALGLWVADLGLLGLAEAPDVVGEQPAAGDRPGLPHIGIAWGPVTSTDERILASEQVADGEGTIGSPGAAGAATWLLGSDEVQARFMLRATTPEDADSLAHQFRGRFALEAARSNDGGDPVLHFAVTLADEVRTGKVYLDGTFNPPVAAKVSEVSLYEQSVGALIVFPRFWVEEAGDESGQMDVTITLNGVAYTPPSGLPAED